MAMTQKELLEKLDFQKAIDAHSALGKLFDHARYQPPELWGGILGAAAEQMGAIAEALCLDTPAVNINRALIAAAEKFAQEPGAELEITANPGAPDAGSKILYKRRHRSRTIPYSKGETRAFLVDLTKLLEGE